METDTGNSLNYWMAIPLQHQAQLYSIRHWDQLQMATEDDQIWVTGFEKSDLKSALLQAIPYKKLYRQEQEVLFPLESKLPERRMPKLHWQPIAKVLPVELPDGNFNYFGLKDRLVLQLSRSDQERPPFGMLVSLQALKAYVEGAAALRLEALRWVILKKHLAFLIGQPLLPIQGFSYWQQGQFLLPTGFDFELPLLAEALAAKLNLAQGGDWIFFNKDASFIRIPANHVQPLSRSSFRLSFA